MNYKEDSLSGEMLHKNMALLTSKNSTKFISAEQLVSDSLKIQNEKNKIKHTIKYDYDFMVIMDNVNIKTKKYKFLLRDLYELTTPTVTLNWQTENETKKIGDYICQKANLYYCGRHWEAWFAKEIPLNTGPYIFGGLPGLILNMRDIKDNFEFVFSGIQKYNNDVNFISVKPLIVNAEQLEKVERDYYNDPYREMKSGKMLTVYQDENGNPIKPDFNEWTKGEQQRIRKNNNPIELCTAIRYSK